MRIISDFHDYYDFVMAHGQDNKIVYNRSTKASDRFKVENSAIKKAMVQLQAQYQELTANVFERYWHLHYSFCNNIEVSSNGRTIQISYQLIVVVGEIYRVAIITELGQNEKVYCWTPQDAYVELDRLGVALLVCRGETGDEKYDYFGILGHLFDSYALCIDVGAPIFAISKVAGEFKIDTVVNLKKTGVSKYVDPYACFQKIAMFIGAELNRENIVPISPEKIRLEQKGFDAVTSFRGKQKA